MKKKIIVTSVLGVPTECKRWPKGLDGSVLSIYKGQLTSQDAYFWVVGCFSTALHDLFFVMKVHDLFLSPNICVCVFASQHLWLSVFPFFMSVLCHLFPTAELPLALGVTELEWTQDLQICLLVLGAARHCGRLPTFLLSGGLAPLPGCLWTPGGPQPLAWAVPAQTHLDPDSRQTLS